MNDYTRRLTVSITEANHKKIADLTKQFSSLTQWDVVNLMIESFDPNNERFKSAVLKMQEQKELSKEAEKRLNANISALPNAAKNKIARMGPEQLAKLLAQIEGNEIDKDSV